MKRCYLTPRPSNPSFFSLFDRKGKGSENRGDLQDGCSAWQSLPVGSEHIIRSLAAERILGELLDKINKRDSIQHDTIRAVVEEFPGTCHRRYEVVWEDGTIREMLPLWIICCLCPPLDTVKAIYEANPEAIYVKEPCKQSLSMHLAAAFEAPLEIVQFIHSKNDRAVRTPRNDGVYPIHLACGYYRGDPSVINYLLDQYPEGATKVCSVIHWSPLHSASHGGISDLDVMKRLHNADPSMIRSQDRHNRTALHLACLSKHGNPALIEFLMQTAPETAGVEDNLFGRTPLHLLCINQAPDTIRVMLDLLPETVDISNTYGGASILAWAAMKNTPQAVDYLARRFPHMLSLPTQDEARYTPLYCAIYNDAPIETMNVLIEHYPQALFTLDGSGRRPLRAARSSGAGKEIIHLLEASERRHRSVMASWFCF